MYSVIRLRVTKKSEVSVERAAIGRAAGTDSEFRPEFVTSHVRIRWPRIFIPHIHYGFLCETILLWSEIKADEVEKRVVSSDARVSETIELLAVSAQCFTTFSLQLWTVEF